MKVYFNGRIFTAFSAFLNYKGCIDYSREEILTGSRFNFLRVTHDNWSKSVLR